MVDKRRSRAAARTAVVWSTLRAAIDDRHGDAVLDVLDAGGGTGGFAVPLAEIGHRVTVVDPSPDSLAALERRAAEAGRAVRGVQGSLDDIAGFSSVLDPAGYDVVVCHHVLEVVDDPAVAVAAIAAAARPGGLVSVLAANRVGAVVARTLAGRFDEAMRLVTDREGRSGAADGVARRFDCDRLVGLLDSAGLRVDVVHGARIFTDLLPGVLLDVDPDAVGALIALETAVAEVPAYRDVAAALHVLATRP